MADRDRYFLCLGNKTGPLLCLHTEWEAREMKGNFEYIEVDADGLPVAQAEQAPDESMPFDMASR